MKKALLISALFVSGCAYNPFQPSPGGVSFKLSQDGQLSYENTGRDIKGANGHIRFPNGAEASFRLDDSTGGAASNAAVAAQQAIMLSLIANAPKLTPADIAKIAALFAGPAAPVVAGAGAVLGATGQ